MSPTRVTGVLSERLLITKIITALGLALMMVIGIWSATHTQSDESVGAVASAAQVTADEPLGYDLAVPFDQPVLVLDTAETVAAVASCLLGVVCGLILLALLRLFRLRAGPSATSLLRRVSSGPPVNGRPFVPAPSLSQLALSRT